MEKNAKPPVFQIQKRQLQGFFRNLAAVTGVSGKNDRD